MRFNVKIPALFFVFLLASSIAYSSPKIDKVEPPFWWCGMQEPQVELLVYGEKLAGLQPHIDYPGVQLERTISVENANYLFLDLTISAEAKPGNFDIEFKNDGKTVLKHNYEIRARKDGSSQRQGFSNADVIYLITPDRFVNGNPQNDNVKGLHEKENRQDPDGRHGGDLQGIVDHLDYLVQMGFTGVWINPVLENDQKKYSYHGYSTTDFYRVDGRFGSNEEYLALSHKAREKGIKLIMDMIVNHCGSEHWWMKDLPMGDWLNSQDAYMQTNHRRHAVQDPYASKSDYDRYVDGWFVPSMPDLNQRNPLMANYLIQNAIWWIEYADLSGIRMDTYSYADKEFMADWTKRIMEEYPDFNIVGEEWSPNPVIVSYWQRGKYNPDGYTSSLPSLMDFPLQQALSRGLNNDETFTSGLVQVYELLATDRLYPDPFNLVIFPDNHDMSRFYTQVDENFDLFKLGITEILTTRGIPQIYYGTEILMSNPGTDRHGIIRSDFPGGWADDKVNGFTGEGLSDKQKQAQAFMKTLINWRKKTPVVHSGKLMHFSPDFGVYVYFRYNENDKVMVVLNKNTEDFELNLGRFEEMLDGEKSGLNILDGKEYKLEDKLNVPARSPMVLELMD